MLSAGGAVLLNKGSVLDVQGGAGGYGGVRSDLAGGGGSGGRIALYGQSVTALQGTIDKLWIHWSF